MHDFFNILMKWVEENPELSIIIGLILAIIGVIATIIGVILTIKYGRGYLLKKRKEKEQEKKLPPDYYKFIWKDAKDLTPEDILGLRGKEKYGYKEYYYERDFHKELVNRIREGKDAIVVGMSLSGKTRTVYQTLKSLGAGYSVTLMENLNPMEKPDLTVPRLPAGRDENKRVLVIDDINYSLSNPSFIPLLNRFMAEGVTVVATCRTGPELSGYAGTELSTLFGKPLEIPKLKEDEAKVVVEKAKVKPPDRFDGNIGSLFIPLAAMKVRYGKLGREEIRVLKAINRLHFGGVSIEKGVFPLDRVMIYYKEKNIVEIKEDEFINLLEDLKEKEFLEFERNRVRVEEAYLDEVIEGGKPSPEEFAEMTQIFINDPDALSNLGTRAHEIGLYDIRKNDYIKISIFAKCGALNFWTKSNNIYKYASTMCNLAVSYNELETKEDIVNNLKVTIKMYDEASSVFADEGFSIEYAITQNNLGITYRRLSKKEEPAENLSKSIDSHENALNIFKIEKFPIYFAIVKNNIGTSFNELAINYFNLDIKDKAFENVNNAIDAYDMALKIRTFEKFPINYAETQNNLGISFCDIARIEKTDENLKKAFTAYGNSLRVWTKDEYPIDYAKAMGNIGNMLNYMATLGNKEENCKKARIAYNEALEIFKRAGIAQYIRSTEKNIEELNKICSEVE